MNVYVFAERIGTKVTLFSIAPNVRMSIYSTRSTPRRGCAKPGREYKLRPVSYVITSFIEKTMSVRGLNLYVTSDGKYLAMDGLFDTVYKFDLIFSDNDFSCQILARGENGMGLMLKQSFNIPWTNGEALRDFMEYVRQM